MIQPTDSACGFQQLVYKHESRSYFLFFNGSKQRWVIAKRVGSNTVSSEIGMAFMYKLYAKPCDGTLSFGFVRKSMRSDSLGIPFLFLSCLILCFTWQASLWAPGACRPEHLPRTAASKWRAWADGKFSTVSVTVTPQTMAAGRTSVAPTLGSPQSSGTYSCLCVASQPGAQNPRREWGCEARESNIRNEAHALALQDENCRVRSNGESEQGEAETTADRIRKRLPWRQNQA